MGTVKNIMVLLAAVALVTMSGVVQAKGVEANVTWKPNLKYEDGTPMTEAEIDYYELHYVANASFKEMAKPIRVGVGVQNTYKLDLTLKPQAKPHVVRIALKTVSIYGAKSKLSNIVEQTFNVSNPLAPQAPVNIKLEIQCDESCKIVSQEVVKK